MKRAIAITGLVLSLAACGSDDDCTAEDATDQAYLEIMGNDFSKSCVKVPAGTMFTVTNRDMMPHTIATRKGSVDTFESGALNKDTTFSYTLANPGTVKLYCKDHEGMAATIIVQKP